MKGDQKIEGNRSEITGIYKKIPSICYTNLPESVFLVQRECHQLWRDIIRAGEDDNVNAHFIGSIVYIEKGIYQVTSQSPILVIDGQQRLTTISLLLAALADKLELLPEGKQEVVEGFSPRKLKIIIYAIQRKKGKSITNLFYLKQTGIL